MSSVLLLRKHLRLAFMRRSVVSYAQKVEDSREILKQYLSKNNFNNVEAIYVLPVPPTYVVSFIGCQFVSGLLTR